MSPYYCHGAVNQLANVKDARVIKDRQELPRGFGFVTFFSREDAQAVLNLGTII